MLVSRLEKWGVIQYIHFDLKMNKVDFVEKMRTQIDPGRVKLYPWRMFFFKNRKNRLLGEFSNEGFRWRFYASNIGMGRATPIAIGAFHQNGEDLIVNIKIGFPVIGIYAVILWLLLISIGFLVQTILHGKNLLLVLSIGIPLLLGPGFFIFRHIKELSVNTDELREHIEMLFAKLQ